MSEAWQGWFDGSCVPNPGQRGIGALLVSPAGEEHILSQHVGRGTNNEAEYLALIALLELAQGRGAPRVKVMGDSQLVIYQVLGVWGVQRRELRPLQRRATELMKTFESVSLQWIRRELNHRADALSTACLPLREAPRDDAEWGTLTDVGNALGKSSIWVGKQLDQLGLRDRKLPTDSAIEQGLGHVYHNGFGDAVQWHVRLLAARLAG